MKGLALAAAVWVAALSMVIAQSRYAGTLDQHPAIDYRGGPLTDVVAALQRDIAEGRTQLQFDGRQGFLRSVLARLEVPVESQILVFSKTGIQNAHTSPENPRALYFNDRVIIGYIPGAPFLELASHDPAQGVIFRTLKQDAWLPGEFARSDRCLGCHLSENSLDVPGILVRSMSTAPDGRAMPQDGSFVIDHRSRLDQRWAGWYVSGAADSVQHQGRAIGADLDLSAYPLPASDIVALMVFDHQGRAMNLLTRLGWEARLAAAEGRLDFSKGDLGEVMNETARYLSFAGEAPLMAPALGVSKFSDVFQAGGRRDRRGRSLRDFDLQTRLFKYRCSYMIYSPAFDALPGAARAALVARLRTSITDPDTLAILDETKPGWSAQTSPGHAQ